MDHREIRELLDDYVDGALSWPDRRIVESHLAACAGCRADYDALVALTAATAALPRSIEPRRDLWPGIAERIGGRPGVENAGAVAHAGAPARAERRLGSGARLRRQIWSGLIAAALALVVVANQLADRPGAERGEPAWRYRGAGAASPDSPVLAHQAAAVVASLAAETDPNPRQWSALAVDPTAHPLAEYRALACGRAQIERAVAELRAAYLEYPEATGLALRLAHTSALRAELDQRAAEAEWVR
jgi:anti-sigma factor RsiW